MRSEKLHLVKYIGSLIADADYVYFVSYIGLKVKDSNAFRILLAEQNATVHVLKNSLIHKAAEELEFAELAQLTLTGGTALVCGKGDAGAVAKIIADFNKKNELLAAKAGFLDGALLSADDVKAIAELPAKPVLQAQLLGLLQAPARNLVSVLNAKAASILNVLNAYKEKIEQA